MPIHGRTASSCTESDSTAVRGASAAPWGRFISEFEQACFVWTCSLLVVLAWGDRFGSLHAVFSGGESQSAAGFLPDSALVASLAGGFGDLRMETADFQRLGEPLQHLIRGWATAPLLLLVAGAIAKKKSSGKEVSVTTEKAVTKTIIQVVTATGKVQPEVEVKITPEVFGEITSLPFREGAAVRKGDVIVTIKPDFYQAQVDQQTAGVAAARASAVNSLVQQQKAEADLKKYQDLYDRKLVSDFDYQTYRTAFDAAKATRASALAGVDEAEGMLKQARDSLSKTSIYSPMDGTVSSRSSEVGERVQSSSEFAGTEIMRVADLSKMEVRVKVNENDIVNVKVGDPVSISIDAYPDRKFRLAAGKLEDFDFAFAVNHALNSPL